MIKVYLKQAWELLKQNKLFSMLYIVAVSYTHLSFRRDRRPPSNGSMITAGMLRFTSSAYRYSASVLRVFTSYACRQST